MPPKKAAGGPSKKTVEKQKAKIVEDKTFGLKNKNKSAKVQKYVAQVEQQVAISGKSRAEIKQDQQGKKKSKAEIEREKKEELVKLLNIAQPKLEAGVDPKSVLCEHFRMGVCTKGDKCKYSHDLNVSRKAEKIDLYTDKRDAKKDEKKDEMAGWDQTQLEDVIEKRHGTKNKGLPPTTIVCKYFLDAVEQKRYGWFWECPNGEKCHYRHCLPPGFVLKSEKKKDEAEEEEEKIAIEDEIEELRAKLETRTPVTLQSFLAWKERKAAEKKKKAEEEEVARKKEEAKKGAAHRGVMSGRAMFDFNPDLFVDDEFAGDAEDYELDDDPDLQERVIEVTGTSIGGAFRSRGGVVEGNDDVDDGNANEGDDDDDDDDAEPIDPNQCPQCSRKMKGPEGLRDHLSGKHQMSAEDAVAEVDRLQRLAAARSTKSKSADSAPSQPSAAAAAAASPASDSGAAGAASSSSASSAADASSSSPSAGGDATATADASATDGAIDESLFDADDDGDE